MPEMSSKPPILTNVDFRILLLQGCVVNHKEVEAFALILKQTYPILRGVAAQLGFSDWWELISEVTLHLSKPEGTYKNLATWTPERSKFSTWIYIVARRRAVELRRKETKRARAENPFDPQDTEVMADPSSSVDVQPVAPRVLEHTRVKSEEELLHLENFYSVQQVMEDLDPQHRKLLYLYYFEGLNAREIAEQWNVSHEAIRQQKSRALRALRVRWGSRL